jgi:hypothetical protein
MSSGELKFIKSQAELDDLFVHFTVDGMEAGFRLGTINGYMPRDGKTLLIIGLMHKLVDQSPEEAARRIAGTIETKLEHG